MLNGVGSEKGKTKNIKSNQQKKQLCTCSTLFCTFLCHCCRNVKFTSYTFYGENVVCAHKNFVACVPVRFFFSLPLIFILLATSISHFFTAGVKFSCCCSSNEICPLCFLSLALTLYRSALFLLKLR